ncbi:Mpo1 family 2-hydroxy fatty acid dioxygenase [Hymenobacter aerophilus]|uniref:Mpo1 family 2-hydroxy fatty acid dioxygenase n=1 Tax=Hymenobacter aerophilus TaxID=119644 RepID=UPI00038212F3|nr:Mpo1-like protein [Hymenobacter aerophilus]
MDITASPVQRLLDEYAESHQNPTNKLVHWVCVPLIMFAILGLLWSVPVPVATRGISPLLNWGTLVMLLALLYYVRLSLRLALGMALVWLAMAAALSFVVSYASLPLWAVCLIVFVLAWIGQFWGHKVEGKKPSFLKDLQFLLIGPLWLLHFVYRRLGWRY